MTSESNGHSSKFDPIVLEDLEPIRISVTIGKKKYVLREASEDAACKYRNASTNCARMDNGRVTGISGPIADVEPILVSLCLFEVYEHQREQKERPVTLQQVRSWPARNVKPLFDRIIEISGLREEEDVEALERRIETDRERLASLRNRSSAAAGRSGAEGAGTAEGDPLKNSPDSTVANSI